MMWMAKLIRTCACPGPAAGCSSTRRRTPRPCSTPTTSPSSTAHWSGSRWKWLFLMKRTILPGPSLRPLTHLGDKNWPLRTFSKLRFKFKYKKNHNEKMSHETYVPSKTFRPPRSSGWKVTLGRNNFIMWFVDIDLDCMHIMKSHFISCNKSHFPASISLTKKKNSD